MKAFDIETRNTYIYHLIKPLIFGVLLALFAIAATLTGISGHVVASIVIASIGAPMFVFFITSLVHITGVAVFTASYKNYCAQIIAEPDSKQLIEGPEGSGKSDTAKRAAIIVAEHNWQELSREYHLMSHALPDYIGNKTWLEHWREVSQTYKFYIKRPYIFPCLTSNVPMQVDGLEVLQFDFNTVMQKANLGYKTVLLLDEMKNSGFSNRNSGKIPRSVDEWLRFGRQFYECRIFATEQNKFMAILEYRNLTVNYTMQEMRKDILSPRFLQWIYKHKVDRFIKKYGAIEYSLKRVRGDVRRGVGILFRYVDKCYTVGKIYRPANHNMGRLFHAHIQRVQKIERLDKLIKSIGFIRYVRVFRGTTQGNSANDANESATTSEVIGRKKTLRYYMPAYRRYVSDTRLFRGINRAKDKEFKPDTWGDETTIKREYWDEIERLCLYRQKKYGEKSEAATQP